MPRPAASTSWERVSGWYASHLKQDDFLQRDIVIPGTLSLLQDAEAGAHLDIACGDGNFARVFAQAFPGRSFVGLDASPSLIRFAEQKRLRNARFVVGDAQALPRLAEAPFTSASCILAIQNIEDPGDAFQSLHHLLAPGAPFVFVLNHPCFRQPRQSGWGWDEERKIQYRRIDRYLSSYEMPIVAHPGKAPSVTTTSYHRSISYYVSELANAGFVVDALEEWTSPAKSDSGPRAKAENVSREEFPLFLAIRARRI